MSRPTGSKAIPPVGIETASTRRSKATRRARRGNGGGPRKKIERWRLKQPGAA